MEEYIQTGIEGLRIRKNKIIGDERGRLLELMPNGAENELAMAGIKNIYVSLAAQKGVARGGHYHHKQVENFYCLTGACLMYFQDMRASSKTFGQAYKIIVGVKKPDFATDDPIYTMDQGFTANIYVEPGIFHFFMPLTEETMNMLAIASEPYHPDDYARLEPEQVKGLPEIIEKYRQKINKI